MRCSDGITDSMDMSLSTLWNLVMDREAWFSCSLVLRFIHVDTLYPSSVDGHLGDFQSASF